MATAADGGQHGYDERSDKEGGAVCGLGRGLGDAHGVNKGVRDEVEELHIIFDEELKRW